MFTEDEIRGLPGAEVYDSAGARIGTVGQLWADAAGQPAWAGVRTGRFGTDETLLPLTGARLSAGALHTPYPRALIDDAPHVGVESEQPLGDRGVQALYAHYALEPDPAGEAGGDEMIRSEERLRAGTERVPAGKVRVRKRVVTENVTVTVPVRREEVRLEHVPAGEAGTGGPGGQAGPVAAGEAEQELILYAERPVVTTETVPVERVRLGTHTVTEQETVGGEVRKERIDLDVTEPPGTD